jgi:hypothetical protein
MSCVTRGLSCERYLLACLASRPYRVRGWVTTQSLSLIRLITCIKEAWSSSTRVRSFHVSHRDTVFHPAPSFPPPSTAGAAAQTVAPVACQDRDQEHVDCRAICCRIRRACYYYLCASFCENYTDANRLHLFAGNIYLPFMRQIWPRGSRAVPRDWRRVC